MRGMEMQYPEDRELIITIICMVGYVRSNCSNLHGKRCSNMITLIAFASASAYFPSRRSVTVINKLESTCCDPL